MDYAKHYNILIARAYNRVLTEYSEKHHVLPKCLGGTNKKQNIVKLTPEEHYVAHQLLVKIYPNEPKLVYAVRCMSKIGSVTRHEYGWIKRKHALMLSETRRGVNNPTFGKPGSMLGRKHTDAAKLKISEIHRGKKISDEHRQKIKEFHTGKTVSQETKQKLRQPKPEGFAVGPKNSMFGKYHTEQTKAILRQRAQNRTKVKCPHCDIIVSPSNAKRWHLDNCMEKVSG